MDGAEALRHLCKWLGEEAALPLEVLTSLEKKLAEEQVFQVEDLMLLRDEGMLQTVFSKHVTRRKVEMALDRRALQASGQQAGVQRAGSGWAAGERERSPAAGGGEAETTPPRVLPQPPLDFRLPKSVGSSGASARRSLFASDQVVAVVRLQAAARGLLARLGEPWLRAPARAARRERRLLAAATLLQAGARGLLARAALRSQWREVAQLLEVGSRRAREARSRLKRRRQKKAKLARLNAEAEAAEAAEAEAAAAAARDEAAAQAARAAEAVAAQAAISAIEERQRRQQRRGEASAEAAFEAAAGDPPAARRRRRGRRAAAAAAAGAAAVEKESESELRGSTCTGVTTFRPSAPRHAHEKTTQSIPADELCMNCLAGTVHPSGVVCDACRELNVADQLDGGTRFLDRFAASREQVERERAAAAEAARPATTVLPKKLRAKKQAAQAAAAAAAERERRTLYSEWEDRWLSNMGWEDYGSEGFSHPPPELFGFNQVRDAVFGDAEYYYACCGGGSSDNSDDDSGGDDDEAEAEAAAAGA